jgi:hypothetical protein
MEISGSVGISSSTLAEDSILQRLTIFLIVLKLVICPKLLGAFGAVAEYAVCVGEERTSREHREEQLK